ncbi:MAG: T9SS type A sorting domain-containing protein, partial [Bacteroidetes bacterium]|nr:T9SS type A sorting domain-containing protein [Bacteroidota bacterium]
GSFQSIASSPYANYYCKWYFGNNAGIDFYNNNNPTAITTSALSTYDYGSAVCDFNGNMLFYTNGETVWDSSNSVMVNGTNLDGSTSGGQTALILRPNGEGQYYYIFTVPEFASANGFRYSIVDMSLQGGRGEVVLKNQLLFAPSAEKIASIYNAQDNSYWVIAHQWGNNNFAAYKLSPGGLDTVPVISSVGHINMGGVYGGWHDATGEMSISPDGTKIACVYSWSSMFELYDFNIVTGIISNPVTISNINAVWGIEFSPDSKKLYTTKWTQTEVTQHDLTTYTSAAIAASALVVGNVPFSGSYACGYLELAPDGKIYVAKWNGSSLSEIDFPDSLGAACGFTNNGFNLSGGISQCGLSPSPVFPPNTTDIKTNTNTFHPDIFPNPVKDQFTIKIPANIELKKMFLNLYAIDGKLVRTISISERETVIRKKDLSAGNYLCELICEGKIISQEKIVIE